MKSYPARPIHSTSPAWGKEFEGFNIEGKSNGWRKLVNLETMEVWNRKGQRSSIEDKVLERLKGANIQSRWIDCEWMGQRTKAGAETLIVMDTCEALPYAERMKKIQHLEAVTFDIKSNALLRFDLLDHADLEATWAKMDAVNNKVGEVLWEGFVMKEGGAYPWTANPSYVSPSWQKMRIRS